MTEPGTRILITFGAVAISADLRDTPTAAAVLAAAPFSATASRWGEEVYFSTPVSVALEADAKAVVEPGEIAFWTEGNAIAIGFGPTPISQGHEIRLAAPCNIWATTSDDVTRLGQVRAGDQIAVTVL